MAGQLKYVFILPIIKYRANKNAFIFSRKASSPYTVLLTLTNVII